MANRNLLHISKLKDFEEWLKKDGWIIEETKGLYEVLRARKDGRKSLLIIYTRNNNKEHLCMSDENVSIVKAFLRDKKKSQTNADRIKDMSEEELADCFLHFSKEDIIDDWCSKLCPHRIKELPKKCEIDLEQNACPCDTKDIVIHWLTSEVKE